MNSTFLVCSYPRSRTFWFSKFFTVDGLSVCSHEATEFAGSVEEFWNNGQAYSRDVDIYGNSDSANVFVLPALLAAKPLTRVVWIERPIVEVAISMKNAGIPFTEDALRVLIRLRDKYRELFDMEVYFHALSSWHVCEEVWDFCLHGAPFDIDRWAVFNSQMIGYSKDNPMPPKRFDKFLGWVQRELNHKERNRVA